MAQTPYQVILSTDGKHTVIVSTDERNATKEAVAWASAAYKQLVERYGLKGEQRLESTGDDASEEQAPSCAVHQVPLVKVQGKRGAFWSCHQRDAEGKFCSYRPNRG